MSDDDQRLRRWRLMLGESAEESTGGLGQPGERRMDAALAALYDSSGPTKGRRRSAGLGASAPSVARWLGDIRTYFPSTVVQVMQKDAIDRLGLAQLLLEPELLDAVEPDVHLVGTLLSLNQVMPEASKATARMVVGKVVREVEERIAQKTKAAVTGALNRSARTSNPKLRDIDWDRTIRANLSHYLPEYRTVVPERLVGYGRKSKSVQRDVVLAIDQSGSMASSVVYASVFGAVLASMQALKTSLVVFDTAVVDLTDKTVRSSRRPFRDPTWWGHGHQPRYRVQPVADLASCRVDVRSDLGPLRGRYSQRDVAPHGRHEELRRSSRGSTGTLGRRGTVVRSRQCSVAECPRDSRVCVHAGQVSGTAGGGSGTRGRVGLGRISSPSNSTDRSASRT